MASEHLFPLTHPFRSVRMVTNVRLSKNAINNAMLEAGLDYVDKVMMPDLESAAEAGKQSAISGFANAKYDGVNDVKVFTEKAGVRTMELTAVGHALPFIEYGTGVYNHNNYDEYGDLTSENQRNYWYFSTKGRGKPQLTAGGEHAEYSYYRTTKMVTKYEYEVLGERVRVTKGDRLSGRFDKEKMLFNDPDFGSLKVERVRVRVKTEPYKVLKGYKLYSFITHGNPPNNVMRHARSVMLRQFNSHYKSTYSKYEE